MYDHSYRSSRYVLRRFHPWLLKELDFVREARKNYGYLTSFNLYVDIYERDMSGFSGCDGRTHIVLPSKIFCKVLIDLIV